MQEDFIMFNRCNNKNCYCKRYFYQRVLHWLKVWGECFWLSETSLIKTLTLTSSSSPPALKLHLHHPLSSSLCSPSSAHVQTYQPHLSTWALPLMRLSTFSSASSCHWCFLAVSFHSSYQIQEIVKDKACPNLYQPPVLYISTFQHTQRQNQELLLRKK